MIATHLCELANVKKPHAPFCLLHTSAANILDIDGTKGVIVGDVQCDFHLLFVNQISGDNIIDRRLQFDSEVLSLKALHDICSSHASLESRDDGRREVCARVRSHGPRKLTIFAVRPPYSDEWRYGNQRAIVDMCCQELNTSG